MDLLVRGGTIVSAEGSRRADVAVDGERIAAILAPEEGTRAAESAGSVVDAGGLLVLPGVVDVHTHTRLATDERPDRFYQDSVAAAFGGTTTFLTFNTTATRAEAPPSLTEGIRRWKGATDGDSAIDYGLSPVIDGTLEDPVAELPAVVGQGIPTAKAFMVYDFRLADAKLFEAMRTMAAAGGMLQVHCEDPVIVDAAVANALHRGNTSPRYHAETRPPLAEAIATARAMAFAEAADAPVYVVHLSSIGALDAVRAAKQRGVRAFAETCPHYLTFTDDRYNDPDEAEVAKVVISPPLRTAEDRDVLWSGLGDGRLDLVGTDHVPDRAAVEKKVEGVSFDKISNGAPGIETLLSVVWSEGVGRGRITAERLVDILATTPARVFGLERKGSIEAGKDADMVLFDPRAKRVIRAADLHHTSDYTPYEGLEVRGAVRSVFVRGRPVIRDGAFVGQRGYGRFVDRRLA